MLDFSALGILTFVFDFLDASLRLPSSDELPNGYQNKQTLKKCTLVMNIIQTPEKVRHVIFKIKRRQGIT